MRSIHSQPLLHYERHPQACIFSSMVRRQQYIDASKLQTTFTLISRSNHSPFNLVTVASVLWKAAYSLHDTVSRPNPSHKIILVTTKSFGRLERRKMFGNAFQEVNKATSWVIWLAKRMVLIKRGSAIIVVASGGRAEFGPKGTTSLLQLLKPASPIWSLRNPRYISISPSGKKS